MTSIIRAAIVAATAFIFLFTVPPVAAQIERQISYQGLLTQSNGQPLTDGSYEIVFRLYDDSLTGNLLWEETQRVDVVKGLFNASLGAVVTLDKVDFQNTQVYLETSLAGQRPFSRTKMTVVPYAVRAETADSARIVDTANLNVVRSINDLRGNLIIEGSSTVVVTKSGDTLRLSTNVPDDAIKQLTSPENTLAIANATGPLATLDVRDGAITSSKLAPGSVTSLIIADNAITTQHITTLSITADKLANGVMPTTLPPSGPAGGELTGTYPNPLIAPDAVTTAKIRDAAVTSSKLADGSVTGDKLAASGVVAGVYGDTANIPRITVDSKGRITNVTASPLYVAAGGDLDGQYPNPRIRVGAVTTSKILDGNVTTPKIADGAVVNVKIADNAVNSQKVQDGTITFQDLAPGTIPSFIPPGGPAGGDLTGTYPSPFIATTNGAGARIVDAMRANFISGDPDVNSANNVVMLDAQRRLPSVDGSQLTNLNAASITTGVLGVQYGGTNSSAALNNNRVMVSNNGRIVEAPEQSASQVLIGITGAAPEVRRVTIDDLADAAVDVDGSSLIIGRKPAIGVMGQSTAIGINALSSVITSDYSTAIGTGTLSAMKYGTNNTAVGSYALRGLGSLYTSDRDNVAVGGFSGSNLQRGSQNVFVGAWAGVNAYNTERSIAIGAHALRGRWVLGINQQNIAVGTESMMIIQGEKNVAMGDRALMNLSAGDRNVVLGNSAGVNLQEGSGNVLLGNQAGGTSTSMSNQLFIDNTRTDKPLVKGDFAQRTLEFNGSVTHGGGVTYPVRVIATLGDHAVQPEDYTIVTDVSRMDMCRVQLPDPASCPGRMIIVRSRQGGWADAWAQTGTFVLTNTEMFQLSEPKATATFQSDGVEWMMISSTQPTSYPIRHIYGLNNVAQLSDHTFIVSGWAELDLPAPVDCKGKVYTISMDIEDGRQLGFFDFRYHLPDNLKLTSMGVRLEIPGQYMNPIAAPQIITSVTVQSDGRRWILTSYSSYNW